MCLSTPTKHADSGSALRSRGASPTSVVAETQASFHSQSEDEYNNTKPQPSDAADIVKHYREKSAVQKLFTSKEETQYLHFHKILGFSALASFIYRFWHCGAADGNFGPHIGTLVFIAHHFLLNASAFIFHIPQRRIRDGGFRIWPEYRFHSLVFTSRSLACMLLLWCQQYFAIAPEVSYWMNVAIVLGTCAMADLGSALQGEHKSNTVRGTTYTDPYGKWFASEMQFNLTALCLIGMQRYTLHLVAVMVIQCNSFLMTLRRKNVASHEVLTAAYGALLLFGVLMGALDDDYTDIMLPVGVIGNLAVILRMGPLHLNKYVLWTLLGVGLQLVRHYNVVPIDNNEFFVYAYYGTKCIALALGMRKRQQELQPGQDAKMAHLALASHAALFAYIYYLNFIVEYDDLFG